MDIKKEQDVEKVQFSELIEKCKAYMASELSQEEFEAYCDKIYFRTYLPLEDKISILNNVLDGKFYDIDDISFTTLQIELFKFYVILLNGYTNIEFSEDDTTLENYNICMSSLGNGMLTVCGIDYQRTVDMLKEYLSYYNIGNLLSMATKINNTSFDEYTKEQKKMFNWIKKNPNVFEDIKEIVQYQDPRTKEFIKNMEESVIKNVNKSDINKDVYKEITKNNKKKDTDKNKK